MPEGSVVFPSCLYFTHTSILPYFHNGKTIHGEIDEIKKMWFGKSYVWENYLPLEVGRDYEDGHLYCNNNRRLYFCRVLEKLGYVKAIKVGK